MSTDTFSASVITASAGSGKTWTLARIMETAIVDGSARPEAVVAITYTRKAAGELSRRLRSRLLEIGRPLDAARVRDGYVGTVHSICERLLAELAFEAGTSPYPTPAPESYSSQLFDETVGQVTLSVVDSLGPLVEALALHGHDGRQRRSFDRQTWRDLLRDLVDLARLNRLDAAALARCADHSVARIHSLLDPPSGTEKARDQALARAALHLVSWTGGALQTELDAKGSASAITHRRQVFAQRLRRTVESGGVPSWRDLAAVQGGDWKAKKVAAGVQPLREQFARHLSHPRLHRELEEIIRRLFALTGDVDQSFVQRKEAERLLDFEDMLARAADVLGTPAAQAALAGRLDLVMVDEFQDTSPVQLQVVLALSRLARRTVWVGDRKQAIFGFQGSDPVLMEQASAVALDGAAPQVLGRSYRSRPVLVSLCSELFARALLPQGFSREEVVLEPACPEPAELVGQAAVHLWHISGDPKEPKAKVTEPAGLARHVRDLLAVSPSQGSRLLVRIDQSDPTTPARVRPVLAGDVAILARSNQRCRDIAAALLQVGVVADVAAEGLGQTAEALLLRAGLALLADPSDNLAAAELLTFTGAVSDPDAWLAGRVSARAQARAQGLHDRAFSDEAEQTPGTDWAVLVAVRALAAQSSVLSPVEAVDAVCDALSLYDCVLGWPAPRRRQANLDALRGVAQVWEDTQSVRRSAATVAGLVAHLGSLPAESPQALSANPDAVRVLTYHKAKGLEWPVVVCSQLDKRFTSGPFGVRIEPAQHFDATAPLDGRQVVWWPWPYGTRRSGLELGNRGARTPEAIALARRSEAEDTRLLYVGFTRARDHLVLVGTQGRHGTDTAWLNVLQDGDGRPLLALPWAGGRELAVGEQSFAVQVSDALGTAIQADGPARRLASSFMRPASTTARPALFRPPSSTPLPPGLGVCVAQRVRLGERQPLSVPAARMDAAGDAIHAFIAADLAMTLDGDPAQRLAIARALVDSAELTGQLAPIAMLSMSDALRRWLGQRAPGVQPLPEWPLRQALADGTVVQGDIDLLLPLPQPQPGGWLIMDHKSFPGGEAGLQERLPKWAGQLHAYQQAVTIATGQQVEELWIHLPVRGELLRLELESSSQGSELS